MTKPRPNAGAPAASIEPETTMKADASPDYAPTAPATKPAASAPSAETPRPPGRSSSFDSLLDNPLVTRGLRNAQLVGPLTLLVLMIIIFSAATSSFLTVDNLTSMVQQNSVIAILGIGLTLVILLGEIDLSFPGIVLVSGATTGLLFAGNTIGIPFAGEVNFGAGDPVVGVVFALVVSLVLGLVTGYLVGRVKVPSFIGSLGVLLLSQGLAYYWLAGKSAFNFPSWMGTLGQSSVGKIPYIAILAVVLAVIVHVTLTRTLFGRFIYMTGASPTAARLSGINTRRLTILVFTLVGLIAGIAGIAYAGNLSSVNGQSGNELLLPTFAAVVLGGNSLLGGSGGIKNTIVGVLIFGVLDNGLLLLHLNTFIRPLTEGTILVIAVALNVGLSKLAAYANERAAARRLTGDAE